MDLKNNHIDNIRTNRGIKITILTTFERIEGLKCQNPMVFHRPSCGLVCGLTEEKLEKNFYPV